MNSYRVKFEGYSSTIIVAFSVREAILLAKEAYYYRGMTMKGRPSVVLLVEGEK